MIFGIEERTKVWSTQRCRPTFRSPVRPSVRPSVRPFVRPSVRSSDCPSVRSPAPLFVEPSFARRPPIRAINTRHTRFGTPMTIAERRSFAERGTERVGVEQNTAQAQRHEIATSDAVFLVRTCRSRNCTARCPNLESSNLMLAHCAGLVWGVKIQKTNKNGLYFSLMLPCGRPRS